LTNQVDISHLIKRCKKGNQQAQHQLFKMYNSFLYSVAMRYLKNKQEAEDALQDAWFQIFKSIKTYKETGQLEFWMKKIMIRSCWLIVKNKKRHLDIEAISHPQSESLDSTVIDKMTCDEILELLEDISVIARQVFKMAVIEGMKHDEIGKILEIKESTSRAHLSRARKLLKEKFNLKNSYSNARISAI